MNRLCNVHSLISIDKAAQKLDSCVVSVYPALNPDHEALAIRGAAELPLHYDIRATVSRDGVILGGADSVDSYQKVYKYFHECHQYLFYVFINNFYFI